MALNFTVSYTFSPSTTISSSQVNTNTSDVASVFQGLEAETKTLAKLKVDIDPTLALEVATKQYVDHYSTYRRPNLKYSSGTVVNIETGINGTSGQAQILFPDGNLRTDSTSGRINCNLAQVAALSGSTQSGVQTGTVSNNTWYAIYAVKTSDNTSNFVTVADKTNLPIQASFATLNSNFGTNSWVYLGLIRYGDNSGTANAILKFAQNGNLTIFYNTATGALLDMGGIRLATSGAAAFLQWTYASGTGAAQIPAYILNGLIGVTSNATAVGQLWELFDDLGSTSRVFRLTGNSAAAMCMGHVPMYLLNGILAQTNTSTSSWDIFLNGFYDPVLGVGSNALL